MPTVKEIADRIRQMKNGDAMEIEGVNIHRSQDLWWVQAGGGTQFSHTPEAAARKARALMEQDKFCFVGKSDTGGDVLARLSNAAINALKSPRVGLHAGARLGASASTTDELKRHGLATENSEGIPVLTESGASAAAKLRS